MRTTQTARYARWSAMVALLLAAGVAGIYVRRDWQERQARKSAPSSVPAAVEQQSAEFSYSKVDGDRTEFTIRASHTTQFTGGDRSVLEDVRVTVFGKDGDRSDNLHTHSCEYLESTGSIVCSGVVQIDLQSAQDARQFPGTFARPNAAAHIMHIDTSQVTFNRKTGTATSDRPVTFRFPQGEGRAVGLRYESQQGVLQLLREVDMTFQRPDATSADAPTAAPVTPAPPAAATLAATTTPPATTAPASSPDEQSLHVTGSSLLYGRDERIIHLMGPVRAEQGLRQLQSGHLDVELDTESRLHRIIATNQPKLYDSGNGEPVTITADEFSALISPQGWADQLFAVGNVHALAHGAERDDRMDAGRADIKMAAGANRPQQLTASEDVRTESLGPARMRRTLATSTLVLDFVPDGDGKGEHVRVSHATTPEAALDWLSPNDLPESSNRAGSNNSSGSSSSQHMHLTSQHLDATFGSANDLRELHGTGGVQVERQIGSEPLATSTSREMVARMLPGGDWTSVDQSGDVHLRQLDRTAQSELAHFDHATDTAVLTGSVVLADAQSRVTAQTVTFRQLANEFRAEGHVVSSEVSAQNGGAPNLAPGPARISSDRLVANTMTGVAVYSGGARLWQGESLIQADTITLDRSTHVLTAVNHVRAVFPQAAWAPSGGLLSAQPSSQSPSRPARPGDAKPEFWRAEANRMTYSSEDGRGRMEKDVYTHSTEGSIRADAVDLFFASSGAPATTLKPTPGTAPASPLAGAGTNLGAQQLIRATANGNVTVEQEDRHGTSTRADYTASEGKFVLSGGPPIVYDASGNSTTGRQLTLFFADDRIVIDSAEGLRTLTLHRVEK